MPKKAITIVLIISVMLNFLLCNNVMAKDMEQFNQLQEGNITTSYSEFTGGSRKTQTGNAGISESSSSVIYTILSFVIAPIPLVTQALLTLAIMPDNATKIQIFTIEDMLLDKFDLFNINYLDIDNITGLGLDGQVPSNTNKIIKQNVANWFFAIRNFSIVALLAILIAIGILMAVNTIASERAKYKQMLIHWVASFALLMVLPYIMSVAFTISKQAVTIVKDVAANSMSNKTSNSAVEQSDGINFEKTLVFGKIDKNGNNYEGMIQKIQKSSGLELLSLVLVYCVLVYYQVKFFFMYLKRMLAVGFLTVISPLITITYSIDKARDNQAQAYKTWIKEFLVNVFIQPLHALLFVIFMGSVYGIMEKAPILAIIFIASLSRGEQLVRTIFKIERTTSMGFLRRRGRR